MKSLFLYGQKSHLIQKIFLFVSFLFVSSLMGAEGQRVMLGIDVLESMQFKPLQGKYVGLLTHPAGVNRRGQSTIDVLRHSPYVELVSLYGPEHGIYGDEKANQPIEDKTDKKTGLPVFSLYGKYRKAHPKMLAGIDTMVIDLQDVGVRSYTYVSCMRYTIEACFENNVEVIVLDRPNPLGGLVVDGPGLDEEWMSYVGAFQTPYVHGLTIGELARMSKEVPGWLKVEDSVRRKGKLSIVPMKGWSRNMLWPQTHLKWIATSPYIPDLSAVAGYPMTGLGAQVGKFSHGIGSPYPFRLLNYSGIEPEQLQRILQSRAIPGISFKVQKVVGSNRASNTGVYVMVEDWKNFRPTALSFHMMQLCCQIEKGNPFHNISENEMKLFNKHVGSTEWWNEIFEKGANARVGPFLEKWHFEALRFQEMSRKYWIYKK